MKPIRTSLILVAAGSGRRMGLGMPKALVPILGKPIFLWALEAFQGIPEIKETILALPKSSIPLVIKRFGKQLSRHDVHRVISGGATRQDSVRRALEVVDRGAEIILVHDAARPWVSKRDIRAVIQGASKSGAAILAAPCRDTLKEENGRGGVLRTLDRSNLWQALTPQGFRSDLLRRAHSDKKNQIPATDDAQLVERLGAAVRLVETSGPVLKVTFKADLRVAEAILRKARR